MNVTVKQRGGGRYKQALERLMSVLRSADEYEVAVGYPKGESGLGQLEPAYDGKASVIEVAMWNNYGLGVPERPFMDLAARQMSATYKDVMDNLGQRIVQGTATVEKVLEVAGLKAEEDVRKAIKEGNWTPNNPATIARKKGSTPLIDTMTLHNRVTHQVRKAGA